MQRKAEQGTFGGRFGGRKSLQSRKSGRFGGTFGGRNSQTEAKLMHVRRHFRRPKLPDRDESLLSGASFGSRRLPPQEGSAAESRFGGRKSFRLPNLVSPKGQKLGSNMHKCLQTQTIMHLAQPKHAYKLLGVSNYLKPQLQHIKHTVQATLFMNIHLYP